MRLKPLDAVAILGMPLAVVGMIADDTGIVAGCFILSAAVISFAVLRHTELTIWIRIMVCGLTCALFTAAGVLIWHRNYESELQKNTGLLEPASDRVQAKVCGLPSSDYVMLFMGSNTFVPNVFPATVISMQGEPILQIDQSGENLVIRKLILLDDRNDVLVDIDQDHVWIKPDVHFDKPDTSTIIVHDHLGKIVLRLRFHNPNVLEITGTFHHPGDEALVISTKSIRYDNLPKFWMNCFRGPHLDAGTYGIRVIA